MKYLSFIVGNERRWILIFNEFYSSVSIQQIIVHEVDTAENTRAEEFLSSVFSYCIPER